MKFYRHYIQYIILKINELLTENEAYNNHDFLKNIWTKLGKFKAYGRFTINVNVHKYLLSTGDEGIETKYRYGVLKKNSMLKKY